MAGAQIEYDESGVTFYYFLVLLYGLFSPGSHLLPMAGQRERSVMAGTCVSLVTTCSRRHGLSSRLSVQTML